MRIIIIGGCPGAGKSSSSKALAANYEKSVLIETDHFFDYLTEPLDPSIPEAKKQNETVISAYCKAAREYRDGGYTVILEGVIGPWIFPVMTPIIGAFDYFLLHTSLDSALLRVSSRQNKVDSPGKVQRMHPQFERVTSDYGAHVIVTEQLPIAAVVREISQKLDQESCGIGAR